MKTKQILTIGLLSTLLLGVSTISVKAAEVVEQTKETPTEVQILDDQDPTDPLDPTDPTQKHLTLEKVPENYAFSSTLKNKDYSLSANLADTIDVFNDRSAREWSVKATTSDLSKDTTTFTVSSFKINDTELVGTGAEGIVAKAGIKDSTNTGLIKTDVLGVSIAFTDSGSVLKAGDKLTGKISYQLYNTPDAQ